MILLISTCKDKLHELEFVFPVKKIVGECSVKHYLKVSREDLDNCSKIIICGTALEDNKYLEDLEKFAWLKDFFKPVLGICSGMQVINLIFQGKLEKGKEIGQTYLIFQKEFLGLFGEVKVYNLHQNSVLSSLDFEIFSNNNFVQAVKHKEKEIYGVLFHPEVFNPELIENFSKKEVF